MKKLEEIALELLDRYQRERKSVIWVMSDDYSSDMIALDAQVNAYRDEISAALAKE